MGEAVYVKRGTESTWEFSLHSAQIFCEPKTFPKHRINFKGRK